MNAMQTLTSELHHPLHGTGDRFPGAAELARQIAYGEVTAEEVTASHIARLSAHQQSLNAVVYPLYDQALAAAREADRRQRLGRRLGPLHGVPITVKETFDVVGTPSTLGVAARVTQLAKQDSPLVQRLRQAGAILLGKTNVPQLMCTYECDNPVYGRTNNPWNLSRSSGGSSGGEAAAVASGGSALGLGSDVGGSLRQPAQSCGIHAIKPTQGRLTLLGHALDHNGSVSGMFQAGPMARRVEDLWLALQSMAIVGPDPADSTINAPRMSDFQLLDLSGMKIGYYEDDGFFTPGPAIRRAVREAAAVLREAGAEVVHFKPPQVERAVQIYYGLHFADGLAHWRELLENSPRDFRVTRAFASAKLPDGLRAVLQSLLEFTGQSRMARAVRMMPETSSRHLPFWQEQRAAYVQQFEQAWQSQQFDALLCPVHTLPAFDHGRCYTLNMTGSYCQLFNILGLPAGAVSVGRVQPGEETQRKPGYDLVERACQTIEQTSTGLPVAVQIAAPRWREDRVLALMHHLESHFQTQADYPSLPALQHVPLVQLDG